MEDRVKGSSRKEADTPEEIGQKAGELLLAVLEELQANRKELQASREESAALRQLLAQVLASWSQETETCPAPEAGEEVQEPYDAGASASQRLNRSDRPVPIKFVDRSIGQNTGGNRDE